MGKIQRIQKGDGFAPAVGPYSAAVVSGGMVYTAGQIGMTPDGKLVEGGVEVEARQVLENLQKILRAAGTDLSHVIKATIYLADVADFAVVNKVYGGFFAEGEYPARETVGVAALPLGARVEISAVAVIPG